MSFSDSDIRAIVETGEYSDPSVVDYIVSVLAARRDAIGRAYFRKVLPLENFRVERGELLFDDLGARYGFVPRQQYQFQWAAFNNQTAARTSLPGETSSRVPAGAAENGSYLSVDIASREGSKALTVYVRRDSTGWDVVGIDR